MSVSQSTPALHHLNTRFGGVPPSIAASIAGAHCSSFGVRSTAHARYFLKVSRTLVKDSGDLVYASLLIVCAERDSEALRRARADARASMADRR